VWHQQLHPLPGSTGTDKEEKTMNQQINPMNPEVKQLWVTALRSGKYKQGYCLLQDDQNRFCCLGVLCDIHSKETGTQWDEGAYLSERAFLPSIVKQWADIKEVHNLIFKNDNLVPFAEIADYIEEEL
jgi:hypothetical protein